MLTLTAKAANTIRALVDGSEIPDAGGLRIAKDPAADSLALSLAAVLAEEDQVVEAAGARLFLEPRAAVILEDKTLDATSDAEGRVQFGLTETGIWLRVFVDRPVAGPRTSLPPFGTPRARSGVRF